MERKDFYKQLFRFASLWNIFAAAPFLFNHKQSYAILGMSSPSDMVWYYLTFMFVALFGIGYYIISRDVEKNHGIAFMGTIGKIVVFAFFLYYAIVGQLHIMFAIGGFGDFVFACFFIEFLLHYRNK